MVMAMEGPVPAQVNEATAWSLLRSVSEHRPDSTAAVRVHHSARNDIWLQVDASGHWETSAPATDEASDLLDLYLPLQLSPNLVVGQIGQSLDGRIATENGRSHYVTGPADRRRLHRLRALVDAVVVGAGTVAADNPRLTVRDAEGANPVRVVLDPTGRLSPDRAIFRDGAARTLVVRRALDAQPEPPAHADLIVLPDADGRPGSDTGGVAPGFAPATLLDALRARGLRRILVEGGGVTVSRFLQAGALTRLHVTVAPMLIGSGRPGLTLPPITSPEKALRPACRLFRLGDDVLFDLDLS